MITAAPDDAELHRWPLRRLKAASDPRRDEYFRLFALINDWPTPERLTPVIDWSVTALRIRAAGRAPHVIRNRRIDA
ncbi:hypothetical protein [Streptomyces sp. AA1529]|uniref:hypothetical protein n=1 Tax=Streptomyces sp. AA1529 TaxID=1203257 RepID=UPI000315CD87|nr:hypothetical protein [Streptomyces sp. AA1529]